MIYDRTDDANPPPLPPESNMPCIHSIIGKDFNNDFSRNNNYNQDLENYDDDHYSIHSELIHSNPSMIPNDGERVVLLSSVSRAEKDVMVKNEVMSGRLFQSIYRVDSNINLLQIVLLIFLQLGCEWILHPICSNIDNTICSKLMLLSTQYID